MSIQSEGQIQTGQQQNKWRRAVSFGKKLIAETVITTLLVNFTGCATVGNNGEFFRKYSDSLKCEARKEEPEGTVKVVKRVLYKAIVYEVKLRWTPGTDYIEGCLKELPRAKNVFPHRDYVRIPFSKKFKKFEVTEIIINNPRWLIGNPSWIIIGIDEKGNYGYMLQDSLFGKSKMIVIGTELPAKKLKELGIRTEIKYDEETKMWLIKDYDKNNKLIGHACYTKDGKEIEDGFDEEIDKLLQEK